MPRRGGARDGFGGKSGSSRRDSRGMCFAEKHDLETDPVVGQVASTQLQAGRPRKNTSRIHSENYLRCVFDLNLAATKHLVQRQLCRSGRTDRKYSMPHKLFLQTVRTHSEVPSALQPSVLSSMTMKRE